MDFLLLIYNRESYSENLKEVIKNIFTRFRFLLTKLCVSFVENIDLRQEKLIYDGDKKYVFLYKMFLIFLSREVLFSHFLNFHYFHYACILSCKTLGRRALDADF